MKQNNIETAREFVKIPIGIGNIPQWSESLFEYVANKMVAYHSYLTAPDSDGAKSAEEMRVEFYGENDARSYDQYEIDLMKAFAAQLRKELSDAEINNEFPYSPDEPMTVTMAKRMGAQWARSKMQNKEG